MPSFGQRLIAYFSILLICMCIVHSTEHSSGEQNTGEKKNIPDNTLNHAHAHLLKQLLNRRTLYDPAYSDSWSSYFEKKRQLFDPAYGDWANRFK